MWCSRRRVASLSPVFVGDWGRGRFAGCLPDVALALLSAVVKKGDAYLFSPPRRVQWWGSLVEQPLPASSLNRNIRNNRTRLGCPYNSRSPLGPYGHDRSSSSLALPCPPAPRAPSDPPAPLCVRARVSAHARTTRCAHGAREPPDDMTRSIRRNTHDLIIQSQNFMALRHHITNIERFDNYDTHVTIMTSTHVILGLAPITTFYDGRFVLRI